MYQDSDRYAANGGGLIQGFCFRPRYAEPMHPRSQGTRVEIRIAAAPSFPLMRHRVSERVFPFSVPSPFLSLNPQCLPVFSDLMKDHVDVRGLLW